LRLGLCACVRANSPGLEPLGAPCSGWAALNGPGSGIDGPRRGGP
jgi:hypothetical protein